MENEEKTMKSNNKFLKISYQIIFWIISILSILFSLIALLAGEYLGGFIVILGAIGINPLLHKIKVKNVKLFHHLRRIICFILVIIGFIIALKTNSNFYIRDNSLKNSHEEIIKVLNDRLISSGERIEAFNNAEINDIGKENNYKIYENKIKDNLSIQLIEKNDRIEAIRTCTIIEKGYNVSEEDSSTTSGLIMGIIMSECGISSEEGNSIIEELENKNYNGDVNRNNFILTMKTTDFYAEMIMIYNTSKLNLIKEINTREISEKISILEEKLKVEEIDKAIENIKTKVENETTSIYSLKESKQTLEKYQKEIESINFTIEEYLSKKDFWKNTLIDLIAKIDEKINISIPDFNTMSSSEAENWGKENSISVTTSTEYSDSIENGKVISQSVNAGEKVIKGDITVKVIYSLGRKPTTSELNALKKAQSYSDNMHMSKKRLYEQLTSSYGEGFTASEAQYAIDHVKADWNYNALQKAKSYQSSMNMSKNRIYQQLTSAYGENFTASEAQYAIDHLDD